jgi:hypothetical protein
VYRKRPLSSKREDRIEMDLTETGCEWSRLDSSDSCVGIRGRLLLTR